jgi:hypothetical protein
LALDVRNTTYSAALDWLELRPDGLRDLTRRGLSSDAALDAGYRSLPARGNQHQAFIRELVARFGEETLRRCPGFLDKNGRLGFWTASRDHDGYIVPYRDEEGRITGLQAKYLSSQLPPARGDMTDTLLGALAEAPKAQPFVGPDQAGLEAMLKEMTGGTPPR